MFKVLVLGNYFVRRLKEFIRDETSNLSNVGFDPNIIRVHFHGFGCATLFPGYKSIQQRVHVIELSATNVLFLQICGNDFLSAWLDPIAIARALISFAQFIIDVFHVSHIIIGQNLLRFT